MREARLAAVGRELTAFVDADRVSSRAQEALGWVCGQGLLSGKGGGVLDPGGRAA